MESVPYTGPITAMFMRHWNAKDNWLPYSSCKINGDQFHWIDLCLQILTNVWLCSQGHCMLCMRRMWQWRGFLVIALFLPAWCLPIWLWTQPMKAFVSLLENAWALACWMSAFVKMVGSTLCCSFLCKKKKNTIFLWQMAECCFLKAVSFWVIIVFALQQNCCLCESAACCNVILTEFLVCLGAPIIMSSPHFYQADEKFVRDVLGMKPNKKQHETTIDINPVGSTTLIYKYSNCLHLMDLSSLYLLSLLFSCKKTKLQTCSAIWRH